MKTIKGYLEIMDRGFGFLRDIDNNFLPKMEDPHVPFNFIKKHNLREGSIIVGSGIQKDSKNKNLELVSIETINRIPFEEYPKIQSLQDQTSINPLQRFTLAKSAEDITGKALDLIVPIGKGQRGMIIAPPKSGKTTILKHMANSLIINHPDVAVFVLLVDERPEEVTDFKRGLKGARVLFSSADNRIDQHMRMSRLALNTAIRCAETGQDAVLFIDSLTRMARASNSETKSYGKTLTGGLGANAMNMPRKFFGAARNLEDDGSLTIIATILVDTGSRMDDIIFQEFKGTGNMDLVLSQKCAEQRIWPAININQSGTRKEDLLLSAVEYENITKFRRTLSNLDEVSAMSRLIEDLK